MQRHLIVLDLDGTLLTDEKVISEKTKKTLLLAKQEGHEIMIATGRPYRSSEMYYKELGLNTPIVNFNGAFVHHPTNTAWNSIHTPIELNVVKEVVEAVQNFSIKNMLAEVLDDVYLHYHDEHMISAFALGNPLITTGDLRTFLKSDPTSLLIHAEEDSVDLVRKHLEDVHAEVIDHRRWGAPWDVIEVIRNGLNKAVGLAHVSDYLNIPKDRIIAFGDEDNDLEMIEFAGVGVAMGNAIAPLQNIANEITLSNNDDGIAEFLIDRLNLKNSKYLGG
ncbi:Cof-type HAD-IIB family hydrolase [Psychrobacillus vulpis]|uniref:HAD family phosphatase n=1 Tax=Psychrobacillus vulpis TaxID=2325572 RepID=A0A544TS14_9BACI|nr:Cof-type HAD-IIB family hydrolase [Psychrobacillus vulpis]TQR20238.1 HAD family phosphatase [Psychrobacillus vulpis]